MSASSHANVVLLLMASVLLSASLARTSPARPDARWAVAAICVAGLACAALVALHSSIGG
jgi:hypothetical protein